MVEPFTSTLLGGALINVGCGLVTNVMDPGRKQAWNQMLSWWERGKTPENHDILRATHGAYVAAIREMAAAAKRIALGEDETRAARALVELCREKRFSEFRWDGEHLPLAETRERIDAMLDKARLEGDAAGWADYNELVVKDLAAWGIDLTGTLARMFVEGVAEAPPWHLVFRAHFAEVLKADEKRPEGERAFRILTMEALAELKGVGAILADAVERLERGQETDRIRDEAFQAKSAAADAEQAALLRKILATIGPQARAQSVTDDAVIELARRVTNKVEDPVQALQQVQKAIESYVRLRDAAAQGSNLGELVDRALREIAAANEREAFEEGANIGAHAFAQWQEQQAAVRLAGIKLVDANIEQNRLRFDPKAIAHWICQRLSIEGQGSIDFELLRIEQDKYYRLGLVMGLRLELDVSIKLAQRAVALSDTDDRQASSQNDLAVSFCAQGERTAGEAGVSLLHKAVAAYRAALTICGQASEHGDWAMTQNNLGNALALLSERVDAEVALDLLIESIAAYQDALTVFTKAHTPQDWAMTQNNLGNTLRKRAAMVGADGGLRLLVDGIAAYRAALTVYSKKASDVDWAMTQNNLGNALKDRAQLTDGDKRVQLFNDAVSAFRAALSIRTETKMPVPWAITQNNLGSALSSWGELTEGKAGLKLLRRSVAAYRAALRVFTIDRLSFHHEKTAQNLASAELLIRQRGG